MSPLKLNGSTSGFVALDAPAAAGSNTLVLPTGNGSANQLLKNSTTAGTLAFSSMVETTTGVGIGTTSPSAKLEVVGGTTASNVIRLTDNVNYTFELGRSKDNTGSFGYIGGTGGSGLTFGSNDTERMRITSAGRVLIGKTTDADIQGFSTGAYMYQVTDGATVAYFNRLTSDGVLIQFRQDTVDEGSISVSGTTVSYNGAHLSRWSQLPSGAEREEILRGTVLSNIDEMCEWGEEDNEQLNRMKVSDVEGDKNVSGVFQAWDDDDDTYVNDFYCAMTGDFIIRIAEGVTVERGDLLMSAGDGTAKPQDDDIIRSKTIAKVTSTHVTCTYDDGSYCVPCVLMAC